jgi:hypothetical protein
MAVADINETINLLILVTRLAFPVQVLCRIEAAGLVECGDVCTGAEDGESALKLAARTAMDDYRGTGLRCTSTHPTYTAKCDRQC